MDLRYVQSFVAVVDHGSWAEAARRLDLTPTAITARVRALEDDLGIALVQRAGRSVGPTEAGLRVLARARAVLRESRDLRAMARGDGAQWGAQWGELKLGVFVSSMTSLLPPVLKALYDDHPQAQLLVRPGASVELCRQVGTGELDAAFVVEPQFALAKGCEWRTLVEEPLVVVAPRALADRDPLALLRQEPFIRYDRAVLGGQLADRYLRDQGIRPQERLEIDGLIAIATLVGQGLGVALLPDWAPMWRSGLDIARLPLPGRAPVRRVGLVWARQGPRSALAEVLLAKAEASLRHLADAGGTAGLATAASANPAATDAAPDAARAATPSAAAPKTSPAKTPRAPAPRSKNPHRPRGR